MRRLTLFLVPVTAAVAASLAPSIAPAQTGGAYDLHWNAVGSGGTTFAQGGAYRLGGAVAQYATGPASGGAYAVAGGLWVPALTPNVGIEEEGAPLPTAFGARLAGGNPFQGATSLRFDLPAPHRVSIVLYGVDGRRVRALVDAPFGAGRHAAYWDGRDDAGRDTAPGIYFARVVAGEARATLRLVRLH